ncbi:hypothetical protein DNTS_002051 [Danionella cerebrum]|uniref:Uncharacterized protein n=1 Tax=Danionella cerebrum TaxID=2873325 RepID=A0A553MZ10_9TELE|nr:hypothetical protein DNTS_002051 [Danionella translucida]
MASHVASGLLLPDLGLTPPSPSLPPSLPLTLTLSPSLSPSPPFLRQRLCFGGLSFSDEEFLFDNLPIERPQEGIQSLQTMANPCTVALELLGMLVASGGWFCSLAATIMPQWLSRSTELFAAGSYEQGLWEVCVVQEMAGIECRPYDTILGLDPTLMLARILMCMSDATGLLGILLAIPSMSQIKCCKGSEGRKIKRGLKISAAVFLCIAGLLVLTPISYVAHDTVMRFFDETVPHVVPRSEFGDALFIGWASGLLYIVSGVLWFSSCTDSGSTEPRLVCHHQRQEILTLGGSRKHTEYV